jgi:hypothetical protein
VALQLGALRDALLAANVSQEQANAAAEEVAGYENRLTRLTTLVRVAIGILVVVLASQAGLWLLFRHNIWSEYGMLWAQIAQVSTQITRLSEQVDQVSQAISKP